MLFISAAVFFLTENAFATAITQQDDITELEKQFKECKDDKQKVEIGTTIAQYYLNQNDAKCDKYATATIKSAKKVKKENAAADMYNVIGSYYYNNKNYKKAVGAFGGYFKGSDRFFAL